LVVRLGLRMVSLKRHFVWPGIYRRWGPRSKFYSQFLLPYFKSILNLKVSSSGYILQHLEHFKFLSQYSIHFGMVLINYQLYLVVGVRTSRSVSNVSIRLVLNSHFVFYLILFTKFKNVNVLHLSYKIQLFLPAFTSYLLNPRYFLLKLLKLLLLQLKAGTRNKYY
jgi:hypothetical protein